MYKFWWVVWGWRGFMVSGIDLESGSLLRNQVMGNLEGSPLPLISPAPSPRDIVLLWRGGGQASPREPRSRTPGTGLGGTHPQWLGHNPAAPGLVCARQSFLTDPRRGGDAAPFLRRAGPGSTRAALLWPFKSPPPSPSPRPAARGRGAGEPRRGLAQRAPPPRPPRGGNRQPRLALTSDRLPASDRGLGAKPDRS